jgi:LDH2 family malate/lactate/ureidoglycolate dehydrogenase
MPRTISVRALEEFVTRYLAAKGFDAGDAGWMAHVIVTTEASGLVSHGLSQLFFMAPEIGKGVIPGRKPSVLRETASSSVIDGGGVAALLAFREAVDRGMAKASAQGSAFVAVLNTGWIGAPGPQLIRPAEAGFLCQVFVQHSGEPTVSPFGGMEARLSTNPVALAFPAPGGPVIADFSTSAISNGRTWQMIGKGARAPVPLYLDKEGNPTTDPEVFRHGGSVQPAGREDEGYKGFALSLWHEALTAAAGGRTHQPGMEGTQNFSITFVSPAVLSSREAYEREIGGFLAYVKSSRPRPGSPGVILPGERSAARRNEAERKGLELPDDKVAKLSRLADEAGFDPGLGKE